MNRGKPGQLCKIKVKTTENSTVSLLGINQASTFFETSRYIDKMRISLELSQKSQRNLMIKGNSDRYLEFAESNAFILTNALYGDKYGCVGPILFDHRGYVQEDEDESGLDFEEKEFAFTEKHQIRSNFADTWIFEDFEADENGEFSLKETVPDVMTSLIVTGFAIHPENGLAIAAPQKLEVFQSPNVKLYLPYSVRIGEIVKVGVTVFNNIKKRRNIANAEVKMLNIDNEFEFIDFTVDGGACKISASQDQNRTKSISVPVDNEVSSSFLIRPLITGQIKIKVNVSIAKYSEEVEQFMLVGHEGLTKTENEAILIDLREKEHDSFAFDLQYPSGNVSTDSIVISASIVGDLLGPALQNIQNLM